MTIMQAIVNGVIFNGECAMRGKALPRMAHSPLNITPLTIACIMVIHLSLMLTKIVQSGFCGNLAHTIGNCRNASSDAV